MNYKQPAPILAGLISSRICHTPSCPAGRYLDGACWCNQVELQDLVRKWGRIIAEHQRQEAK